MKHAIIRSDGFKPRKITAGQLLALRTVVTADAIEKGTVTIAIEGEEPDEFVLPTSMIEMLLEGIGASSAAPVEEEPVVEEQLEALDAGEPEDEKLDAKAIRRMIADAIDRNQRKRTVADARTASVHSDAATILPPAYDYSVPWQQVALDAIAKAKPELETEAGKLSKDSKTDAEAAGMLRQMLRGLRQEPTTSPTTLVVKGDGNDNGKPWLAPTMPTGEEQ